MKLIILGGFFFLNINYFTLQKNMYQVRVEMHVFLCVIDVSR